MQNNDSKSNGSKKTKLISQTADFQSPGIAEAFSVEFLTAYPGALSTLGNQPNTTAMLIELRKQVDAAIEGTAKCALAYKTADDNTPEAKQFIAECKAKESALIAAIVFASLRGTFSVDVLHACEQLHRGAIDICTTAKKEGVSLSDLRYSVKAIPIEDVGTGLAISVSYGDPANPKFLKPGGSPDKEDAEGEREDGLGVEHPKQAPILPQSGDDTYGGRLKPPSNPSAN